MLLSPGLLLSLLLLLLLLLLHLIKFYVSFAQDPENGSQRKQKKKKKKCKKTKQGTRRAGNGEGKGFPGSVCCMNANKKYYKQQRVQWPSAPSPQSPWPHILISKLSAKAAENNLLFASFLLFTIYEVFAKRKPKEEKELSGKKVTKWT